MTWYKWIISRCYWLAIVCYWNPKIPLVRFPVANIGTEDRQFLFDLTMINNDRWRGLPTCLNEDNIADTLCIGLYLKANTHYKAISYTFRQSESQLLTIKPHCRRFGELFNPKIPIRHTLNSKVKNLRLIIVIYLVLESNYGNATPRNRTIINIRI